LLAVRLGVDGGEYPVRPHALQQMNAGDTGAGADLDDRLGVRRRGEQPQGRSSTGRDGAQTRLAGPAAGPYQRVVLGDEGVRERPARLPVAGNGPLPFPVRAA
jgi:hypothetical protein